MLSRYWGGREYRICTVEFQNFNKIVRELMREWREEKDGITPEWTKYLYIV